MINHNNNNKTIDNSYLYNFVVFFSSKQKHKAEWLNFKWKLFIELIAIENACSFILCLKIY